MSLAGYALAGLWKPLVTRYYVMALPVVMVAIFLGRAANGRMDSQTFLRFVHVGLVAVGGLLLLQALA